MRPSAPLRPVTDKQDKHVHSEPHVHVGVGTPLFWWYIAFIIALVLLGGVFSGLTLGLMGLDPVGIHATRIH